MRRARILTTRRNNNLQQNKGHAVQRAFFRAPFSRVVTLVRNKKRTVARPQKSNAVIFGRMFFGVFFVKFFQGFVQGLTQCDV